MEATENGFVAVKCLACGLIYVNPRPSLSRIDDAVRTGAHSEHAGGLKVVGRRVPGKVARYKKIISQLFADVLDRGSPISWLDVGAGFGEIVEAVSALASFGSHVEGLEPMKPKADVARARGLSIREAYLNAIPPNQFDIVSVINVLSHLPDFRGFLEDVKKILSPNGEILIETGNAGDLVDRSGFPGGVDATRSLGIRRRVAHPPLPPRSRFRDCSDQTDAH